MAKSYPSFDKLPIKCIDYIPNVLPAELANVAVNNLIEECKFLEDDKAAVLIMGHK